MEFICMDKLKLAKMLSPSLDDLTLAYIKDQVKS